MRDLVLLKPFFGCEKTLVITCHECFQQNKYEGQVFCYQCLGNMLRKNDTLQQEYIRYYLDVKGCSQIILAGHYNCHVIQKMLSKTMDGSLVMALEYNMDALLEENARAGVQSSVKNKMMIEVNVIEQLKLLMSYGFVYDKVTSGILKVIGLVLDDQQNFTREIFRNGIAFNNLVVSN